jgi:hypothetical protein
MSNKLSISTLLQHINSQVESQQLVTYPQTTLISEYSKLEYNKGLLVRIDKTCNESPTEDSINWSVKDYGFYTMFNGNVRNENKNFGGNPTLFAEVPLRSILLGRNKNIYELSDKLIDIFTDTRGLKCKILGFKFLEINKLWVQHDELITELYIKKEQSKYTKVEDIFKDSEVGISAIDYTVGFYYECYVEKC